MRRAVKKLIKEAFAAPLWFLPIARIFVDVRLHPGVEDVFAIGFAIKARVEIERCPFDFDSGIQGNALEIFQPIHQQHGIGLVDRRDRQWRRQDVTVVIANRDHLFARLVLVAAIADSVAPFLATVFEPSPWSKLKSSFFSCDKCLTEATKAFFNEPSSAQRAKSL